MAVARRKRFNIGLVLSFLMIALVFGWMFRLKYQASRNIPPVPHVVKPAGGRTAVLFFVADGGRLAREARDLDPCNETGDCVRDTLDALLSGSVGEYDEAIPESAVLNSVRIEGSTAVVDLSQGFVTDLPAGSSAEMLAVYSLVDTVCANHPGISRVKLTVEGNGSTVLGHLDLSRPLAPDYSLEQGSGEPAGAVAPARTTKEKP